MDIPSSPGFNEIYTSYYQQSYIYVKSYIHNDMAAEDIVSDSLIKLWEIMKKEIVNPVGPYLFSILKTRSLDYLKHEAIKQSVHDNITDLLKRELEIRTNSLEASDPKDVFSDEVNRIFERTLNSLSEKTKDIFIKSRFQKISHKEIAETYGISVKGVDYHMMLATNKLRRALKDYLPLLGVLLFL